MGRGFFRLRRMLTTLPILDLPDADAIEEAAPEGSDEAQAHVPEKNCEGERAPKSPSHELLLVFVSVEGSVQENERGEHNE